MTFQFGRRQFLSSGIIATIPMASARSDDFSQAAAQLSSELRRFLWQSQQDDGSWRSEKYGVLRSGQALTPFVLSALIESDDTRRVDSPRITRSLDWMRGQLRGGCLGVADPEVLEYPVFATAFAVRCFVAFDNRSASDSHSGEISAMRSFLLAQQFNESRGFHPSDLAYGGWGFGGNRPPGQTGHMDLSHVRWTLQALHKSGGEMNSHAIKAERLLRLLQKHPNENRRQPLQGEESTERAPFDGGFYFSPIVLAANKGRIERDQGKAYFRSYATATCDGLLALLAAGVDPSDTRVRAAKKWLAANPSWDYPAGIPHDHPEPWGDAVHFYHQAVRAEVYRRLQIEGDWPAQLIERLNKHLGSDGSISNRQSPLMKEDDPILCTTLALMAVTEAGRSGN